MQSNLSPASYPGARSFFCGELLRQRLRPHSRPGDSDAGHGTCGTSGLYLPRSKVRSLHVVLYGSAPGRLFQLSFLLPATVFVASTCLFIEGAAAQQERGIVAEGYITALY